MPDAQDESKVPEIFPGIFCPGRDPSENSSNPHLRCGRCHSGVSGVIGRAREGPSRRFTVRARSREGASSDFGNLVSSCALVSRVEGINQPGVSRG